MPSAICGNIVTAAPMAKTLLADYPEIEHAVRINRSESERSQEQIKKDLFFSLLVNP